MSTLIQTQLEKLLEHELQLNIILDNQDYKSYQEQESLFSEQVKLFIINNSTESLNNITEQIKDFELKIKALQKKSEAHLNQLKEKSLLQRRNKNKLKAYKSTK